MNSIDVVSVTVVNANIPYRVVDMGGLRAAALEPVDEQPAPPAETETAARRLVVVTSGVYSSHSVDGVVELAADAPGLDALKGLFAEHVKSLAAIDRRKGRDASLVDWLVARGYALQVAAVEWNFEVFTGWEATPEATVTVNEYDLPAMY